MFDISEIHDVFMFDFSDILCIFFAFSEILDLFMFIFLFRYFCCHCFSNEDVDVDKFLAAHLHFCVYH